MDHSNVMASPRHSAKPSDPEPIPVAGVWMYPKEVTGNKRFLITYIDYDGEFQVQTVMAMNLTHALGQFTTMAVKIAETLKTTPNYELYSITRAS